MQSVPSNTIASARHLNGTMVRTTAAVCVTKLATRVPQALGEARCQIKPLSFGLAMVLPLSVLSICLASDCYGCGPSVATVHLASTATLSTGQVIAMPEPEPDPTAVALGVKAKASGDSVITTVRPCCARA